MRTFRMQIGEATALQFSWPERRPGFISSRTLCTLSNFSFNDDAWRKKSLEFNASLKVSFFSKCHSVVLFPASLWAGFKTVVSSTRPIKFAVLEQPTTEKDEPVPKGGGTLANGRTSRKSSSRAKKVSRLSPKNSLASITSKMETLKLSSYDIEKTRAKLEHLGVEEPALLDYIAQNAPSDVSVDDIVTWISSLMGVARVRWSDAVTILSKCPGLVKTDTSKVKDTVTFLKEIGLTKEEIAGLVTNHPSFFEYELEEMRTSIGYLISVGVPEEDIPLIFRERPQALNAKTDDVKYSIGCMLEAGVIPEDLPRLLRKVPDLFSDATRKNLKPRLDFFEQVGLSGGSLGKGIARRPNLLHFDLESMKQAYNYLSDFLPPNDLSKLVCRFAEVLVIDPKRKMEPMVNHLLRLGVKPENLGKVLLRRPQLLGYTVAGLEPTLEYLKELGVTEKMLGRIITIAPQVLTLNCEERLKPAVEYLRSIGLQDKKDLERLLVRNAQLLCCSIDKNIAPKFKFFLNIGLEKEDVIKILVLFPSMFGQSIELSLEPKYRYLVDVMKRSPKEIIDFPQYFGYSMENRIKPRYERLKARGLTNVSLPSMLACVESDFISRYLVGDPPSRAPYNLKKAPRRSKYTD